MRMMLGSRIGPYEILSPIGAGGMGEVYRARDTKLNRDVAVKVLPASWVDDPDRLIRFEREAHVLASLNHPNIGAIYGREENALVMELIVGSTLMKGPLPVPTALGVPVALEYARQIAEALEYAHEKGVVHRDLKPANIMITAEGQVKLLDFGLAKIAQQSTGPEDSSSGLGLTMSTTRAGMIVGTPFYMAPEQARGQSVDWRVDIWAFGAVLFEMLTGKVLFDGETFGDTLAAILKHEPDLGALPQDTPPAIRKLLRRCLERDRKKRLQSMGDARIEIDECLTQPETAEVVPVQVQPTRRRWLPWAVAGAFAALAVVLSLAHFRESPPQLPQAKLSFAPPGNPTIMNVAVSPDGRRLAVAQTDQSGRNTIVLRSLDSTSVETLPGSEGVVSSMFWSPDSRYVGFFAGGKLKKVDISGGRAVTLCNADGKDGSWGSQGDILFTTPTSVYRVSDQGGEPRIVSSADRTRGEIWQHSPSFLPDGRHYLVSITASRPDAEGVYAGSLDSQERTFVLREFSNIAYAELPSGSGSLLFSRNGSLFAQPFDPKSFKVSGTASLVADNVTYSENYSISSFSVSNAGVLCYLPFTEHKYQLTWFHRDGTRASRVGEPSSSDRVKFEFQPWLSPDEKEVAFDLIDAQTKMSDLWLVDLARNVSSRFTFDSADEGKPVWSPDGTTIAFSKRASSVVPLELNLKPVGRSGKERLLYTVKGSTLAPTDWSRDGRFLMFLLNDPKTKNDLWVLPDPLASGDPKPVPFAQSEFNENDGAFSPDSKWVAYNSDESGSNQVYVQPFPPSGGKWQISKNGGKFPKWRRDGKEMFFVGADNKMMAVDIKLGDSVEAGIPKALFQTTIPNRSRYAVTGDGQRFLAPDLTGDSENSQALPVVMLNWAGASH
jgi:eukaryotic-like serine/threonine-protein kinase